MNPTPLHFYFEFASPYAYFASLAVEDLCARHGLELVWKPVMLGAIFKHTGAKPLLLDGVRGQYAIMDIRRWAKRHDIPLALPTKTPTNSLKAARGLLYLRGQGSEDNSITASYVHGCFSAHWVEGLDLYDDDTLAGVVRGIGENVDAFFAAISRPELKQQLIDETEHARRRGVFGAPTFIYGDEMVWGNDRMGLLEQIIAEHGAHIA